MLCSLTTRGEELYKSLTKTKRLSKLKKSIKTIKETEHALTIFYLIEMVWPYSEVHPISLLLYSLSLLGSSLLGGVGKKDVLLLIWFIVVFVFYTSIPNKHWRYVLPLFPVLAILAASSIFFFYEKAESTWRGRIIVSANKKRVPKVATGLFTIFLAVGVFFYCERRLRMECQIPDSDRH